MKTLHGLLADEASKWQDRVAVTFDHGHPSNERWISYLQLLEQSKKVCGVLARCGLEREVVIVALLPTPSIPSVLSGVLSVPAAYLPYDPAGLKIGLQKIISVVGVRAAVVSSGLLQTFLEKVQSFEPVTIDVEGLELCVVRLTAVRGRKYQHPLAYVIMTSGTTGSPKIVRVPHSCIVPNILHLREIYELGPQDVVLQASPLTFDPSVVEIFATLSSGGRLVIVPEGVKMVPQIFLDVVIKQRVSVLQATPSLMCSIGVSLLSSRLLCMNSALRILALGGEACPPPSVLRSWRSTGNATTILNIYGITEVSSWAMCYQITSEDLSSASEIPLGNSLMGTLVEVRDDNGQQVTEGIGHLFVGGPERVCIIDDESETPDDVMRPSGDRVLVNHTGTMWYRGRIDRQVKRFGKRVNLDELEQVSSRYSGVTQGIAVRYVDQLHLFVVTDTATRGTTVTQSSLAIHLREYLPAHYQPDGIWLLQSLPITRHGKVDHDSLRLLIPSLQVDLYTSLNHTDKQKSLQHLWNTCLGSTPSDPVDPTSTLLTSGGDSVTAVRLLNMIDHCFGHQESQLLEVILTGTFRDLVSVVAAENCDATIQAVITQPDDSGVNNTSLTGGIYNSDILLKGQKNMEEIGSENPDTKRNSSGEVTNQDKTEASGNSSSPAKRVKIEIERPQPKRHRAGHDVEHDKQPGKQLGHGNCCLTTSRGSRITTTCFSQGDSHGPCPMRSVPSKLMQAPQLSGRLVGAQSNDGSSHEGIKVGLDEVWSYDMGKCVDASPLIVTDSDGSVAFVGSHSRRFAAISLTTGCAVWEQILGDRIESSACLSPCAQWIVVGCYDHLIYVMDRRTGSVVWTFTTRGPVKSSPVANALTQCVYVGSHDQHVYCLDIENQSLVWQQCLKGGVFSSPCISNKPHILYAASLAGILAALNPGTGDVLWQQYLDKPVFASPCLTPDGVVVGCVDGCLYHFNNNGSQIWTIKTGGPLFSSPCLHIRSWEGKEHVAAGQQPSPTIIASYTVVCGCHDNTIYCVDSQGGLKWTYVVDCPVYATPFIYTMSGENSLLHRDRQSGGDIDLVAISTTRGRICLLDMTTGRLLGDLTVSGEVFSSPVVVEDCLLICCRNDNVYRFKLKI